MSSLRRGHANLLCIVPIKYDPQPRLRANFGKVANRPLTMKRARGDQHEVTMRSRTYVEGELAVRRSLEESFFHLQAFSLLARRAGCFSASA